MKKITSFLLMVMIGINSFTQEVAKPTQSRIPAALAKYKLGMSLAKFKKIHPKAKVDESNQMTFRQVIVIKNPAVGISEVTFYFDSEDKNPLYEMIINYKSKVVRDNWITKNYGKPNNEKEWQWPSKEGFEVKAWKFEKSLVIVGVIEKTEYADGSLDM